MRRRPLLLLETYLGYDEHPMSQFAKNRITDRTLDYLTPANSIEGIRAWFGLLDQYEGDSEKSLNGEVVSDLISCALLNGFQVGRISRLRFRDDLRPAKGHRPEVRAEDAPSFLGVEGMIRLNEWIRSGKVDLAQTEKFEWVDTVRTCRLKQLYENSFGSVAYFSPPCLHSGTLEYAHAFALQHPESEHILPTKELFWALRKESFWANNSHLSEKGARVYSDWLFDNLIETGLLRSADGGEIR